MYRAFNWTRRHASGLALLAVTASCAPPPPDTTAPTTTRAASGARANVIELEEIERSQDRASYSSVFELIQSTRSAWFTRRGGGQTVTEAEVLPDVYMDGVHLPASALRQISLSEVSRIEYLSASDATLRFGVGHGWGAIVLTTRRR